MKLFEYADSDALWLELSHQVTGALNNTLMHEKRVSLVVPGGTTPGPLYDVLSAMPLDWARVDVLLTDERWVGPEHPRSNARLLRERLLVDKAAAAHFLPYYTGGDAPDLDLADVVRAVEARLPSCVALLGMGEDMHVASLFPATDTLARALTPDAPALVPVGLPGAEEPRVTLSARALNAALGKHLVILGRKKREVLEMAWEIGDPMVAPIAAMFDGLCVHWAAR